MPQPNMSSTRTITIPQTMWAQQVLGVGRRVEVRLKVALIHQETARIQGMLSKSHGFQLVDSGQEPGLRRINLAITWLQQ